MEERDRFVVENFAGIKKADIEFRDFTVLIGPQAHGKSVVAKLYYIMKYAQALEKTKNIIISTISDFSDVSSEQKNIMFNVIDNAYKNFVLEKIQEIFDRSSFPNRYRSLFSSLYCTGQTVKEKFEIRCRVERGEIKCSSEIYINNEALESNLKPLAKFILSIIAFKYIINGSGKSSDKLEDPYDSNNWIFQFFDTLRDIILHQIFIPANRSIYALVQQSPDLWKKASLDPIFIEFGSLYESVKNWWFNTLKSDDMQNKINMYGNILSDLVGGTMVRTTSGEAIQHSDGRKVNILFASSGQKEMLPLVLTLLWIREQTINNAILYIEEPEAHLFPEAQKRLVELIAEVYNEFQGRLRIVITTHSPYILATLNNLLYAGYIRDSFKDDENAIQRLKAVVPEKSIISPSKIAAYEVRREGSRSILDKDGLIDDNYMDTVTDEIYGIMEELSGIYLEAKHGVENKGR